MKTIKEIYKLSYDTSGFNSGLIEWYNQLIDKSYDMLNTTDVCKMFRQDIIIEVAERRAIDLFIEDPYDGEFDDGDLLDTIISQRIIVTDFNKIKTLKNLLNKLEKEYLNFEWFNEESKEKFLKNIYLFKKSLYNS